MTLVVCFLSFHYVLVYLLNFHYVLVYLLNYEFVDVWFLSQLYLKLGPGFNSILVPPLRSGLALRLRIQGKKKTRESGRGGECEPQLAGVSLISRSLFW